MSETVFRRSLKTPTLSLAMCSQMYSAYGSAAAFLTQMCSRAVVEDPTHDLSSDSKEVCSTFPINSPLFDQS